MFIGSAIAVNAFPPQTLPILAARSSGGGGDALAALVNPFSIVAQPKLESVSMPIPQGSGYQQYTQDCWFKVPVGGFPAAGSLEIWSIEPFSLERGRIKVTNSSTISVEYGNFNGGVTTETFTSAPFASGYFAPDSWHHFVWTFESLAVEGDSTLNNYARGSVSKLWVDGVLVVTSVNAIHFALTRSQILSSVSSKLRTGLNSEGYHAYSIIPKLLTDEQCVALYNGGIPADMRLHPEYQDDDFMYYLFGGGEDSLGNPDGNGWTGSSPNFAYHIYNMGTGALDSHSMIQSTVVDRVSSNTPVS